MPIRPATIQDAPKVMRLYHFLFDKYQDDPETFKKAINHPATQVFVLEEAGQIVGTAAISYRVVPSYGPVGYIDDVVVGLTQRGKGFGKALSQHCVEAARQKGCKRIDLTTNAKRVQANQLYQNLGFKKIETNVYSLDLSQ